MGTKDKRSVHVFFSRTSSFLFSLKKREKVVGYHRLFLLITQKKSLTAKAAMYFYCPTLDDRAGFFFFSSSSSCVRDRLELLSEIQKLAGHCQTRNCL
jgi:hypothetical protein